nr:hydroxylamine oxidoreductase, HAO=63 kda octa-heme subunit {c-type heme peptide IV} [Nitrosomonas europaea, Peptide Partial, 15 aa] [Nitrosomonas europaea]
KEVGCIDCHVDVNKK